MMIWPLQASRCCGRAATISAFFSRRRRNSAVLNAGRFIVLAGGLAALRPDGGGVVGGVAHRHRHRATTAESRQSIAAGQRCVRRPPRANEVDATSPR